MELISRKKICGGGLSHQTTTMVLHLWVRLLLMGRYIVWLSGKTLAVMEENTCELCLNLLHRSNIMSELSIQQYMAEFRSVYPKTRVRVHASQRGFQVRIDGDKVGEPMTREELESATRNFRAPAPRQPAPFTAKLGDIARSAPEKVYHACRHMRQAQEGP